jgi:hypothetical protein
MIYPNCHADVGEGKKFCGRCGAAIRIAAAPPVGTISAARRCPKCGSEVQPGKKFCGHCGSSLAKDSLATQQPQQISTAATVATPLSPSPALSATVRVQPPSPPVTAPPPLPPALTATVRVLPPAAPVRVQPPSPPITAPPPLSPPSYIRRFFRGCTRPSVTRHGAASVTRAEVAPGGAHMQISACGNRRVARQGCGLAVV